MLSITLVGQHEISKISDSLLIDAKSVIRSEETHYKISNRNNVSYSYKLIKTVLKGSGREYLSVGFGENTTISGLKAKIYNQKGEEIESVGKRDFTLTAEDLTENFSDDFTAYFYAYKVKNYPITIEFEYESENSNSAIIRKWQPYKHRNTAIEKSSYTIEFPVDNELIINENNLKGFQLEKEISQNKIVYQLKNSLAIKREDYSPRLDQFTPVVNFSLKIFSFYKHEGEAKDWKELGKWYYQNLLLESDDLTEETKKEIQALTSTGTAAEKLEKVYKYVQQNFRYISIQDGIQGFQPIGAQKVHSMGYGDCKGLTNYTRSLLSAAGIPSHISLIYGGRTIRDVNINNPSIVEGNHVILSVPNINNDTVWLECTSKVNEAGELGGFVDGRKTILLTAEGGITTHTPIYSHKENSQFHNFNTTIQENGSFLIDVNVVHKGTYREQKRILDLSETKKEEYFKNLYSKLQEINLVDYKAEVSTEGKYFQENYRLKSSGLKIEGKTQVLFDASPFFNSISIPARERNRSTPFLLERNKLYEDSIVVNVPKNFTITNKQFQEKATSKFGDYTLVVNISDGIIKIHRKLLLNKGFYPKEEYAEFRKFIKQVRRYDSKKQLLVISK